MMYWSFSASILRFAELMEKSRMFRNRVIWLDIIRVFFSWVEIWTYSCSVSPIWSCTLAMSAISRVRMLSGVMPLDACPTTFTP